MIKVLLEAAISGDIRNNYTNINSFPIQFSKDTDQNTKFLLGQYRNLSPILEDDTVEELIFGQPLNVLKPIELLHTQVHWLKKMKVGATLKVHFIDIRRLGDFISSGKVTLEQIHMSVIGNQHYRFESVIDLETYKNVCKELKVSIETISVNDPIINLEIKK